MDEDSESFQITRKKVGAEPSISIPADSSTLVLSLLSLIDLVMVPHGLFKCDPPLLSSVLDGHCVSIAAYPRSEISENQAPEEIRFHKRLVSIICLCGYPVGYHIYF